MVTSDQYEPTHPIVTQHNLEHFHLRQIFTGVCFLFAWNFCKKHPLVCLKKDPTRAEIALANPNHLRFFVCHPYMVMGKEVPEYEEALETTGKLVSSLDLSAGGPGCFAHWNCASDFFW